jgi:hypothetical protein
MARSRHLTTSSMSRRRTPQLQPSHFFFFFLLLLSASTVSAQDTTLASDGAAYPTGTWAGSYQSYYFVSIALVLCALGLALYFYIKRKKQNILTNRYHGGVVPAGHGPARMVDGQQQAPWDASHTRRRYWQGRWRMDNGAGQRNMEEGLNEHGEAPPPYIPKTQLGGVSETAATAATTTTTQEGPAIPLQTLSRDHAGLKPPDYSPATANANGGGRPVESSVRFA